MLQTYQTMSSLTPTIIFLNLPPKTFVGIDLLSFNSSPKFQGITNIQPGYHFIYTGTDASLAIRHGHWIHIKKQSTAQFYVFNWIAENEALVLLEGSDDTVREATNAFSSSQGKELVDYQALKDASSDVQRRQNSDNNASEAISDSSDWTHLTSQISETMLNRILGERWTISSVSSAPNDTESIPGLSHIEASSALSEHSNLNVTTIDLKQTWPDEAIGRDRTEKARDRSWYLSHLIDSIASSADRQHGARDLLGEIQFCFLMVLTLANYSCLEQWKRILTVLFTSIQALVDVELYFVQVLKTLRMQLMHVDDVEGGLFEMREELGSMWLRNLLSRFRGNVEDVLEEKSDLRRELVEFENYMRDAYGWENQKDILRKGMLELEDGEMVEVTMDGLDEEEEIGEYAPVIVDT